MNFAWCVICDVTAFFFLTEDFRGRFWQLVLYPLLVPKAFFTTPPSKNTQERRNQATTDFFIAKKKGEFLIFFGKRALKFTPEARKPHTRTRNTDNKNVFRSFLLCWHQSRRQDERPRLCFLEKSLLGASLRGKKIMVGSVFFFSYENRKRKRASARFRALVTSISIDLSNRANVIVVG